MTKGNLILLPLGSLQLMKVDQVAKSQTCIKSSHLPKDKVYVVNSFKCDFVKETGLFCPYWFIKTGEDKNDCIMTRQMVKHGNLQIPAYVNKNKVDKGTPLVLEPPDDVTSSSKKRKTK